MKPKTLLSLLVFVLAFPVSGRPAVDVKLGTLAPDGSAWYNVFRDMAEGWKEVTGGKVVVRMYPGGISGDEPDMVRKMRAGQLHAAALSGVGLSDIAPEIQALQMPMMFQSYEEFDYVMERMSPKFEAILESKGFKVLNWGDAGWVHFFSQKPVVCPEDLQPLKLFVWNGNTAYVDAYKDAGFHPVPLAAPELLTGLETGLVNAFSTTPLAALSFQWFGLAKNMTDMKWALLVGATIVTNEKWKEIPDDVKPSLLKAARDAGAKLRETRKLGSDAVEEMTKRGLVVHPVSPEALRQWERDALAGYPKLEGKVVPSDMVDEVRRLRDEYRALHHAP